MREILFRGQTRRYGEKVNLKGDKLPGKWVYGGVFHQNGRGGSYSIIYSYDPIEKHTVYADTVGQYTGLTDKNGIRIFEGDIVEIPWRRDYGVVVYEIPECRFEYKMQGDGDFITFEEFASNVRVIGNIHDNPELPEGEQ